MCGIAQKVNHEFKENLRLVFASEDEESDEACVIPNINMVFIILIRFKRKISKYRIIWGFFFLRPEISSFKIAKRDIVEVLIKDNKQVKVKISMIGLFVYCFYVSSLNCVSFDNQ